MLTVAVSLTGSDYATQRWVKWQVARAEKSAKSESKTYTTAQLAGYSATFRLFESGLGTPDTFMVVSADSTDTAWFFWSSDTFWIETTDSVYIAKLMGLAGVLGDSIEWTELRSAVRDSIQARTDSADIAGWNFSVFGDSVDWIELSQAVKDSIQAGGGGACMWNDSIPQIRARLDTVKANLDTALAYIDTFCFSRQIVLWSGAVGSIPTGWQLCDGTNGTPDLRDRFVVGAGGNYVVDSTGGAATHSHTINSESTHTHAIAWEPGADLAEGEGWQKPGATQAGNAHTHTENAQSNLPPFYALCYIMKL